MVAHVPTVGRTIVLPIMFDLARSSSGKIIPGPGTAGALDCAMWESVQRKRADILLTATVPYDPIWEGCKHGKVAEEYVRSDMPHACIIFHEARWYSTIGEAVAAAEYIQAHNLDAPDDPIVMLVVMVKWWHLPRTRMIVRRVFRHKGLRCQVVFKPHWLAVTLRAAIHEVAGYVANYRRISDLIRNKEI